MRPRAASLWAAALALLASTALAACSDSTREPIAAGAGTGGENAAGEPSTPMGGRRASGGAESDPSPAGAGGAASGKSDAGEGGTNTPDRGPLDPPYAHEVVSFTEGEGAGFNADAFPGVVLGPPKGLGPSSGSLDVLSLGAGGEIVLTFGNRGIVDGEGSDFVVFENPFWPSGEASAVFAELGEVSVSEDGETWLTFECDAEGTGDGRYPGCAGWSPTLAYDAEALVPLDPALTGGDAFDLADVGLAHARFVKIRDLRTLPVGGINSGFDLDAVGLINAD